MNMQSFGYLFDVSSSAHSDNLKPMKTPKPINLDLLKKSGFNPPKPKIQ